MSEQLENPIEKQINRGIIDTSSTHIHYHSPYRIDTGTPEKRGMDKLTSIESLDGYEVLIPQRNKMR
jgi:hypothetical protein